jgi:transcriptional regulator with XRE-family HTH domain
MEDQPELPETSEYAQTRLAYARAVGSRLRAVRHQTGLSLMDVEAMSNQEFRQSVLGSYERGDRAITVPRLQRLARIYDVPIDQLLPPEHTSYATRPLAGDESDGVARTSREQRLKVSIDLPKLRNGAGPEHELLRRFLEMIQLQRQDFNGRMITIRSGDLHIIACILGITPDAMDRRLDDLGLRVDVLAT